MAKTSMIQKELKKESVVKKYSLIKNKLKKDIFDLSLSLEERSLAKNKFYSLPRNASKIRLTRRCKITGRPHGVYRKFGLSRNKLREMAMKGYIPGIIKSSW